MSILQPLLFFWSCPALGKQAMETPLKGKKMCGKHLLNNRFVDVYPPKMHITTLSLLQVPAQSSLQMTALHLPTMLSAHCHACPPSHISVLSFHPCPALECEPQKHTGLGLLCSMLYPSAQDTKDTPQITTKYMSGFSQPCEVDVINVPVYRWGN